VLTVLVDARNVLRSTWPNIPEEELVAACRRWAREQGAHVVAVFDGRAPGGLVGEHDAGGVAVVGTGSQESADAWLARAARTLRDDGAPFWLVTSDRALRAVAGEGAERIVGGGRFARELERV
jgi:predicted RNA-binding protein with PIN domain